MSGINTYSTSVPVFSDSVVRPDDMLALRFEFINFRVQLASPFLHKAWLIKLGDPAFIVVHLPPQNIAEQAFFETTDRFKLPDNDPDAKSSSDSSASDPGGVKCALGGWFGKPWTSEWSSGWSRLVFRVPPSATKIEYSLEALLSAISTYDLNLAKTALPPGYQLPASSSTPPSPPSPSCPPLPYQPLTSANTTPPAPETSIEAPYRLIISPDITGRWAHSAQSVQHGDQVELWHTRLEGDTMSVRAIWSPDFVADPSGQPVDGKPPHYNSGIPPIASNIERWFRMPLDDRDRDELVHLSANFYLKNGQTPISPNPIQVNRLMLSSLGAWLDVHGTWDPPSTLNISEWAHRATMGRDHYVKVVYEGFLFPFGHRAALVKITERKFEARSVYGGSHVGGSDQTSVAYLKQRMYIVVREPEKEYPAPGQPWKGRKSPFQKMVITDLVTPDLTDPASTQVDSFGQEAFWPRVGNPASDAHDFLFHFIATDWDNQTSEFAIPLVFVSLNKAWDYTDQIITDYVTHAANQDRRRVNMVGQRVAFAPSKPLDQSNERGQTALETGTICWGVERRFDDSVPNCPDCTNSATEQDLKDQHLPPFFPCLDYAEVRIDVIDQLTNTTVSQQGNLPAIQYQGDVNEGYLWWGFDGTQNLGEVFAKLVDPSDNSTTKKVKPVTLDLKESGGKVSGGLMTPSMNLVGLSRLVGTVGGGQSPDQSLNNFFGGDFVPTDLFPREAKILGGIELARIIKEIGGTKGGASKIELGGGENVPKLVSSVTYDANGNPTKIVSSMSWTPIIKSYDPTDWDSSQPNNPSRCVAPLFAVVDEPNSQRSEMSIEATLTRPLDMSQPSYTVNASLTNVTLNLLQGGGDSVFVSIPIQALKFDLKSGTKPNVSAQIGNIGFSGVLTFIDELAKVIPQNGFQDPPYLDINPSGITAGYSLGVPTIGLGAISLQNLNLVAELNIPFIGEPARFRFQISEREHPFIVTVAIFGGGGFFGIHLGLDGVELMEGALEFGGNLSIDIGVASGGVYAMAGIYFKMEKITQPPPPPPPAAQDDAELTGFFQMGGCVEVLGLVSVSTEFYLGLSYDITNDDVWGQASVIVEVHVLFFHKSLELGPIEKRFGHSPPPPTFGDLIDQEGDWSDYAHAFA